MNSITDALLKLIKLEQQYVGNPVTCGQEVIYTGSINPNSTVEIIIPHSGDLIQTLNIMYSCPSQYLNTVYTGLQAQCKATASTPNSYPPEVGLEFSVGGISNAYIETEYYNYENKILNTVPVKKLWPLRIFKINTGLKLICDYEVNLLRPYQVTKLVLVTDKSTHPGKYSISTIANYIFVDIESRRKLFF